MNIEDHPDLQNLRLSKKDEREALAIARAREQEELRRRQQALGMPARSPEQSIGQRYRTRLVVIGVLGLIVAGGVLVAQRARPDVIATAPPTTGTVMTQAPAVDLSQPFVNTPAAGWADGAAGIVSPAPAPVGSYSADHVAAAYDRVRQLLVTSRLDAAVLKGHDVARVLSQLAPNAREQWDLSHPSTQAYLVATRVADGFDLLPVQPKVTGTMSAAQDPQGALVVHTNFLFAYAFAPADPDKINDPLQIVTLDRFEAEYTITDGRWPSAAQGVWVTKVQSSGYAMACGAYRRGELAPGYSEQVMGSGESIDRTRAFDPNSPLPTGSTCPE